MPGRYVMAISCICHYRPAHKLVTAHLECRALLRVFVVSSFFFFYSPPLSSSLALSLFLSFFFSIFSSRLTISLVYFCLASSFRLLFIRTYLRFVFSVFFLFAPTACHQVVCIAVAKRRSLSSLINVDPLLIYRHVALKVNAPLERTTLGIPVAR